MPITGSSFALPLAAFMMPRIASTANIIEIKLMMLVIKYNLQEIANLMRTMFAEWIDNGHNNFDDVNT